MLFLLQFRNESQASPVGANGIYKSCGPILASIESFISNSKSAVGSEDFMVLYGKLQTGYHLKGYPDSILDLEING